MTADQCFREGKLDEAIGLLGQELRDDPADVRRRVFLFELLSFAGEYGRAEKQLDVLATDAPDTIRGTLLYRAALHAERTRFEMFREEKFPETVPSTVSGTLNEDPFSTFEDADPRIGARLEIFAAGEYLWVPLEHVASVRVEQPGRLRDLLWAPAVVTPGAGFEDLQLGEVFLPVMTPMSSEHTDNDVRLGRATHWIDSTSAGTVPVGQKMFLVDGEEFPLLELRHLVITASHSRG